MSTCEALERPLFQGRYRNLLCPGFGQRRGKYFTFDVRFISDAAVVLLMDLRGIAVNSHCDDPFVCTSTTYGISLLLFEQLENVMVRDITRIREIDYDTRVSMTPRINCHCTLWNGLLFRLSLSNFGLYGSWRHRAVDTASDGALRHSQKAVSEPPSSIMRSGGYKATTKTPSLPNFSSPKYSPYTVLPLPSSSSRILPTQPPPTPEGLRHPIALPPVKENSPETSTAVDILDSLRPPRLSIDLSQDISPYILTLRGKPDMSPKDLPANMILVSMYLPWRIHISPSSVRDVVVALYTALRTRVTSEEMKAVGGKDVTKAFGKRVERAGEEERRKGVRRVDFLLGYTRFIGIEPSTDEPGVWRICLTPLS
ncbi:hypothetical protein EDD85DRAFT_794544 [Armillaria nabsnona]|nr:hypothetical protein EDD85DRAFT_794544 [Armillaria nabsnona]